MLQLRGRRKKAARGRGVSPVRKKPATIPQVFIIESLDVEDETDHREGEVLKRTLALAGKKPIYRYIRTRRELEKFADEFSKSRYRYLHFSCHGNEDEVCLTFDRIPVNEFGRILGPRLRRKRLFMSACSVTTENLARAIFNNGGCISVLGPRTTINMDASAVIWPSFYQLMFNREVTGMHTKAIVADMILLGHAFAEQFRLFRPVEGGPPKELLVPTDETLKRRIQGVLEGGM